MSRIDEIKSKMDGGIELRTFSSNEELRAASIGESDGDEKPKIEGYAAVFNAPSDNLGMFVETIRAGAFDGCDMSQCKALWNHNDDIVLGSVSGNTLRLEINERGLFYSTTPPDTALVNDTCIAVMRRGDVDKSSFRFVIAPDGDEWRYDPATDIVYRSITKIDQVLDVSPVTFPAYNVANSALRSAEKARTITPVLDTEGKAQRDAFIMNSY